MILYCEQIFYGNILVFIYECKNICNNCTLQNFRKFVWYCTLLYNMFTLFCIYECLPTWIYMHNTYTWCLGVVKFLINLIQIFFLYSYFLFTQVIWSIVVQKKTISYGSFKYLALILCYLFLLRKSLSDVAMCSSLFPISPLWNSGF